MDRKDTMILTMSDLAQSKCLCRSVDADKNQLNKGEMLIKIFTLKKFDVTLTSASLIAFSISVEKKRFFPLHF